MRHSVRARPAHPPVSMATIQVHSVASQTAKKIMETLECLSSPLTDARRLPMRPPPPRDATDLHQVPLHVGSNKGWDLARLTHYS